MYEAIYLYIFQKLQYRKSKPIFPALEQMEHSTYSLAKYISFK